MISSRFADNGPHALLGMIAFIASLSAAEPTVDLSGYRADSGVNVRRVDTELRLQWSWVGDGRPETGELVLDLRPGRPLIRSMG